METNVKPKSFVAKLGDEIDELIKKHCKENNVVEKKEFRNVAFDHLNKKIIVKGYFYNKK